jgi:zinc transport system substrate-binding protein
MARLLFEGRDLITIMGLTRRRLLAATAGTVGVGSLAGCTGDVGGTARADATRPTVRASFFVFGDLAATVAGDAATAESLAPVGQHGHGWEPGPRVRESIHDADLFVHGPAGFQPWVDRIGADLDADGSDVVAVDASAGLELLDADDGHGHDHADGEHGVGDDHDEDHADGEHGVGDDHDEDHPAHAGTVDPHFWMDPLRVGSAVENVRRGLAAVDAAGADAYATNAGRLRTRLTGLHERTEAVVAGGSTDVVLVAGHNSFRYFGDRYGVTVESLTDASPDDRPTTRDVERARAVVADHGLRYVCADPLESQRAAEQLVAETDAEAVLPLTAMPGLTPEWDTEGWGYVDVVENVNLPTLERALGG